MVGITRSKVIVSAWTSYLITVLQWLHHRQVDTMPGSRGCASTISCRIFRWFCSFWVWSLRASIFWTLADGCWRMETLSESEISDSSDFPRRKLQQAPKRYHDLRNHLQCRNNKTDSIVVLPLCSGWDIRLGSHRGTRFWSIPHVMVWICWNPLARLPPATWSWCDSARAECHLGETWLNTVFVGGISNRSDFDTSTFF